ncbi:hypothetical protein P7K49_021143 [Saguinus oedipus]|uniref:Uncharacterized protein n=1 Tax=Saguinus oedipus TaxID=9490 RepID=A0ABQ9USP0_SAGOE|nr:hypothetical protein P7K49_021143 [Saguinus oedipus]
MVKGLAQEGLKGRRKETGQSRGRDARSGWASQTAENPAPAPLRRWGALGCPLSKAGSPRSAHQGPRPPLALHPQPAAPLPAVPGRFLPSLTFAERSLKPRAQQAPLCGGTGGGGGSRGEFPTVGLGPRRCPGRYGSCFRDCSSSAGGTQAVHVRAQAGLAEIRGDPFPPPTALPPGRPPGRCPLLDSIPSSSLKASSISFTVFSPPSLPCCLLLNVNPIAG